jgi:hypothetical protein
MKNKTDDVTGEGYVYTSYGKPKYLKHAVASTISLRRYDSKRPVALVCTQEHIDYLKKYNQEKLFTKIILLNEKHTSITGFKHNVHLYKPFKRNLYLDSDIIWCKDPDPLWTSLSVYPFTITGIQISDHFFGGPKHIGVLKDILLRRRQRTLNRFDLTYLSRVQTGMIYTEDEAITQEVCELAASFLEKIDETHFQSRLKEKGRSEESCEWSMAMAMSKLNLPVYPWLQGHTSPQLDFIESYTDYDPDFHEVKCTYYSDQLVYNLRGLNLDWLRNFLTKSLSLIPGKGDYLITTPYCLHFGWLHHKEPFLEFSEKTWKRLIREL